ncbi:hypothetical protein AB1Y20_013060 [Prymnesium parvum]|uniref:Uncharacterized protein n=1 Tax=Prymnesium parvum TaxID=97485 RepID=A0AB34IKC8_PRYPA
MFTPEHAAREQPPDVRKPSQSYVDNYIAHRGNPVTTSPTAPASSTTPRGRMKRNFYQLEETCPGHYYPKLHEVDPGTMLLMRRLLLVLCFLQVTFSLSILYLTYALKFQHDALNELFTYGFASLCAFAGIFGLVGTCFNSRSMLLFFYINQLWGLSNVGTFFVMDLVSNEQSFTACRLYHHGELTRQQLDDSNLDCDEFERSSYWMIVSLSTLLAQLWFSCFLSKLYSEKIQDRANDASDKALIDFVWHRRREMWVQLERFEDVVQRQFEELRVSLVHRHSQGGRPQPPMAPSTTPSLR